MYRIAIPLALASCAHFPSLPLDALLARVDVPRLLACADRLPDYGSVARCLGVETATQGLQIAIDRALEAAERAREAGHGGGAEISERDRETVARDLERAMDTLAIELAAAQ